MVVPRQRERLFRPSRPHRTTSPGEGTWTAENLWPLAVGAPTVADVDGAGAANDGETDVVANVDLVVGLLREQAPHLAGMTVRPSPASGSSNWAFRLGDSLAVRLPRSERYVPDVLNEVRWLPRLGPALSAPAANTRPIAMAPQAGVAPWRLRPAERRQVSSPARAA